MTDICRLCLSVCSEPMHNLCENNELVSKIATCLQVEVLLEESLPNLICYICADQIDQIRSFLKTVIENQNTLYRHLKSGKDCLNDFYLSLKNIKDEATDNLIKVKEENSCENTKTEIEVEIKQESNENNHEEGTAFSSDDEVTLMSLKNKQEIADRKIDITFNCEKTKSKKTIFDTSSQNNSDATDTKENVPKHTTIFEFKCLMCFEVFDTRVNLTHHYKKVHKPINTATCDLNNYSTVVVDGETKFKCGLCDKIYNRRGITQEHIKYVHDKNRPYTCKVCGRTYRRVTEIIQHLRAHNGVKLFCSYNCGYSSAYIGCLKTHEKTHRNEYKYKCEECGKGFEVRTWYEEHQNIHTGAKPFVCNICGLAYPFKKYLVKHKTNTHPVAEPPQDKIKFVCVHCSQACESKSALQNHLLQKHGLKRSFLCDICGKSFKRSTNLISHKKFHAGVRSYTCSTCEKSFITRKHLTRHMLIHIGGNKKHACGKCGKRYVQKSALLKHQLRYHSAGTKIT
ncbi:hypothetical protein O0L34_g5793 [Tuta absoluta]|nr:hypothetical protein O0L34_g5793 [Tuta absoluta]